MSEDLTPPGSGGVGAGSSEFIESFAPTGTLRAAINLGNIVLAQRGAPGEGPRGVSVALARELGRRLGLPVELVLFDAAVDVFSALRAQLWDVAFLAVEPGRAEEIDFTDPYVTIEGTYMVPADSPSRVIADVDRVGNRIAVGRGSAYDLFLTRTIKNAEIVRAATGGGTSAIDLFLAERLDVAAGVRQQLANYAIGRPELRLMEGAFMTIQQAMGMPKGRPAAISYLRAFVEEMKACGFVAGALGRTGQTDAQVAPPAARPPAPATATSRVGSEPPLRRIPAAPA